MLVRDYEAALDPVRAEHKRRTGAYGKHECVPSRGSERRWRRESWRRHVREACRRSPQCGKWMRCATFPPAQDAHSAFVDLLRSRDFSCSAVPHRQAAAVLIDPGRPVAVPGARRLVAGARRSPLSGSGTPCPGPGGAQGKGASRPDDTTPSSHRRWNPIAVRPRDLPACGGSPGSYPPPGHTR
jgi:hypothetical protein